MLHRVRDRLVRQRTRLINALRGHLAEFGIVGAQGPGGIGEVGFLSRKSRRLPLGGWSGHGRFGEPTGSNLRGNQSG
jgi:hypothetical protein